MATRPHSKTTKAERNNDQLFPLFDRTFSAGTAPEFAATADKLAHWLKVDKAYYPSARPKVSSCASRLANRLISFDGPDRRLTGGALPSTALTPR